MQLNVANKIAANVRRIVINHPNALECLALRKQVTRADPKSMGGMRVLSSEDEHEVEYTELGAGYVVFADQFQGGGLFDSSDAVLGDSEEYRFLIEPEVSDSEPGHWTPQKRDIIYLVFSDSVRIAYELVGHTSPVNMPPFKPIWIANRVSEMDVTEPEIT